MKKLLSILTVVLLFGGLFCFTNLINAVESTQDQACNAYPGNATTIWRDGGIRQYFKPTQNHITRLGVYINSSGEGVWKISLKNSGGTELASDTKNNASFGSGVRLHYLGEYDKEITPGAYYYIQLERVSGTTHTYWFYKSDPNCNANGYAYHSGVQQGFDMDFRTWGYTVTSPSNPPATPPSGNQTGNTGNTSTTSTDSSKLITATAAPEDPSIKEPILTYIEKDEKKTDAPITKAVVVGTKDKLKAVGTSFAGARVAIFISDLGYNADTDAAGNWSINLPVDKLKDGEQLILGQAQKDAKGSVKKELFKVKVLAAKTGSGSSVVKSWFAGWNIFCTLTAVGILLALLMLLLLIAKRHKDALKGKKPEKKKPE